MQQTRPVQRKPRRVRLAAAQALAEAAATGQAAGDSHVAILALGELGVLRTQQGRLREAAATYRQALARGDDYARRSGRRLPMPQATVV